MKAVRSLSYTGAVQAHGQQVEPEAPAMKTYLGILFVIHRISLKGPEGKSDFWLWFVFVLHFFSSNFWAFKEMDTLVNIWYHSVSSFS